MLKNNSSNIKLATKKTIMITAGGTGGHMYPAESLACEFNKIGWNVILVSDERGKKFIEAFPANIKIFIQNVQYEIHEPFYDEKRVFG